jgi:hypothetical protein
VALLLEREVQEAEGQSSLIKTVEGQSEVAGKDILVKSCPRLRGFSKVISKASPETVDSDETFVVGPGLYLVVMCLRIFLSVV